MITVIYGPQTSTTHFKGTVADLVDGLGTFDMSSDVVASIGGQVVSDNTVINDGETVVFTRPAGEKGA